jgi:hypothetical protein
VRRLFFDSMPDELVAPLTAALEHINVTLDLNSSQPPMPNQPAFRAARAEGTRQRDRS